MYLTSLQEIACLNPSLSATNNVFATAYEMIGRPSPNQSPLRVARPDPPLRT